MIIKKVTGIEIAEGFFAESYFFWDRGRPFLAPTLFLLSLARKGVASNTIRTYKDRLKTFFQVLSEWKGTDSWIHVNDSDITAYVNAYLIQQTQSAKSSVINHIAALREFYEFAQKAGLVTKTPSFEINLRSFKFKSSTLMADNIYILRSVYISSDVFKNEILPLAAKVSANEFVKRRAEIILLLGYYAGLRSSEVTDARNLQTCELKKLIPADFLIPKPIEIKIIGKNNKLRALPIPSYLVDKIRMFLYGERSYLKEGPLICSHNGKALSKNSQLASDTFRFCIQMRNSREKSEHLNINNLKSMRFHDLRKCFATNLVSWCYEYQLDPWILVPEYMGHADKQTTFIYVFFDAVINHRVEVLKRLSGESTTNSSWFISSKKHT